MLKIPSYPDVMFAFRTKFKYTGQFAVCAHKSVAKTGVFKFFAQSKFPKDPLIVLRDFFTDSLSSTYIHVYTIQWIVSVSQKELENCVQKYTKVTLRLILKCYTE